jgi:phosphoglycolate phosphatase
MKDIRVIIFDCDGVMFETSDANRAYYNHILTHFNRPKLTQEQFVYAHQHTAEEVLIILFEDKAHLEAARAFRQQMSYAMFIPYMNIEPSLKPLLNWLRPCYKTAIATNRSDTMPRVLKEFGLEGLFDKVVTSLDVIRPKPDPEPLLKILEHFQIRPTQALYIGDSEVDENASKAADIPLVAYKNPALSTAAFHISDLKEIETILEQ